MRSALLTSADASPHLGGESPHQVPTGVGTKKPAWEADESLKSPKSPPFCARIHTLLERGDDLLSEEGDLRDFTSRALRVYPRKGGDFGDLGVDGRFNAEFQVPTGVGTGGDRWGPESDLELPPSGRWFCPLWFSWPVWRPGEPPRPRVGGAPWVLGVPVANSDLPPGREAWPPDALDEFEERAGLIEFLGRLPREDAERLAEACVRRSHARRLLASGGGRP